MYFYTVFFYDDVKKIELTNHSNKIAQRLKNIVRFSLLVILLLYLSLSNKKI